jgi:uncharacterized protein (TIGR02996 family)
MEIAELILLQEVTDFPDCNERRLVYSDWLVEKGDLRGEFLQLEVELELKYRRRGVAHLLNILKKHSRFINRPRWQRKITNLRFSQLVLAW